MLRNFGGTLTFLGLLVSTFVITYYAYATSTTTEAVTGYAGPVTIMPDTDTTVSGTVMPGDTIRSIAIEPRFVNDENVGDADPWARLQAAASQAITSGPQGDRDYEDFLDAAARSPYAEAVYEARYGSRLSPGEKHYLRYGQDAFRKQYRKAVAMTTARDMLPVFGCALEMDLRHAMARIFDDRHWRAGVDKEVMAAIHQQR